METKSDVIRAVENESFAPEYRDRLRTWLVKMIHSGKIPGLCWENEEQTIFRMPWKHAGRQDYNLEEDSKIFMAWAKHSGRYREGIDKPEPIVWKTRLRCALNKMPDIRELPERSRLDISEPYRVYQLLPPVHKASQIRRRLYKRSQSHDTDHVMSYNDQSHSSMNPSEHDKESWVKKMANPRRNSAVETAHYGSNSRTSPITSGAVAMPSPGYWFAPSVAVPLKSSMSTAPPGLHLPQPNPLALDSTNPLHSITHSRYPIVPPLHAPFSFPPTSIPGLFAPNATGLAAFRQLGLVGQGSFRALADQKYQDHLSFGHKLEENEKLHSDEIKFCQRLNNVENLTARDVDRMRNDPTELQRKAKELESVLRNVHTILGEDSAVNSKELHPLYAKLKESHRQIEILESDLARSRSAHAREREAREKLESERERMKLVLERMGEGLRALAIHIHPRDEKILNDFRNSNIDSVKANQVLKHDVSRFLKDSDHHTSSKRASAVHNDVIIESRSSDNLLYSPFVAIRKSPVQSQCRTSYEQDLVKQEVPRKRTSSPLDLTVPSPAKVQRMSEDESDTCWGYTPKSSPPSLIYVPSTYTATLSPGAASCDDKRLVTSPSSASSCSPDVTARHHHVTSDFRSRSLSPPQRTSNILQSHRQGTIQVT